jgi:O-antigen/teichoic acid export membrane protein
MRGEAAVTSSGAPGAVKRMLESLRRGGAVSASLTTMAIKVSAAGFAFLVSLLVARRFGAEGSGVFGIGLTILSIAAVIPVFAFEMSSLKAVSLHRERGETTALRSWIRSVLVVTLISCPLAIAAIVMAREPLTRLFLDDARQQPVLTTLAIASLFVVLARLFASFLRASRSLVAGNVTDPLLSPLVFVVLFLTIQPMTLDGAALVYLAGAATASAIGAAAFARVASREGWVRGAGPLAPLDVVRRSLSVYGSQVGGFASQWIPILALGYFSTLAETGQYRVSAQLALLLAFVQQSIELAVSPIVARHHAQGRLQDIAPTMRRLFFAVLACGVFPGFLMIVFSRDILALFGPSFPVAAPAAAILIGCQVLSMALGPIGSVLLVTGLERVLFRNAAVAFAMVLCLSLLLIPTHGAIGAAVASGAAVLFRAVAGAIAVWMRRGLFLPFGIVRRSRGDAG